MVGSGVVCESKVDAEMVARVLGVHWQRVVFDEPQEVVHDVEACTTLLQLSAKYVTYMHLSHMPTRCSGRTHRLRR